MSKGAWSTSTPQYVYPYSTRFLDTAIGALPNAPASILASSTIAEAFAYIFAGTNLNADKLDGEHGSYYKNAGNLNAGTIPDARLPGRIGIYAKRATNLDSAVESGYYFSGPSDFGKPESDGWWCVDVNSADARGGVQIAMLVGSPPKMYYRYRGSSFWGNWYRMYMTSDDQSALWAPISHTHTLPAVIELACSGVASAGANPVVVANRVAVTRCRRAQSISLVRASLDIASTSGIVTIRINKNGTSIFSTNLTIDATELTSKTAATSYVLTTTSLAEDDEISVDVIASGTAARGLVVAIIGAYS